MCWKSTWGIECDGLEYVASPLQTTELCSKLSVADQARVTKKNLQLATPKTTTFCAKIPRKTTPNYAKLWCNYNYR